MPKETESTSAETNFSETKMFEIAPPFLMDTKGNKYFQAYTALTNNIYTLSIEKKWLEKLNSFPLVLDPTILHNSSANFATGTHNRSWDEGSGAAPLLTTNYHELAADINTVGLWHMNEASGNAVDSSGNGNTGVPTGTTVVAGKLNNGRSFNGSSDSISIPDSDRWAFKGDFSIETWVNFSSFCAQWWTCAIVAQDEGGGSTNKWIFTYDNGGKTMIFHINSTSGGGPALTSNSFTPQTGIWYHITVTRSGNNYTFYINGNQWGTTTNTYTIPNANTTLKIGLGEGSPPFNGLIDEVRISNIARTPEEIKQDAQRFPYSVYTSPVVDLTTASSWTRSDLAGKRSTDG